MNVMKQLINRCRNENGVTMIEMLMAICILAVGILAVVALQTASAKGNSTSLMSTDGLIAAMDQIEKLMDRDYDHADLDSGGNPHSVTNAQYTITWNVTDNGVINNTKTIAMTVTWTSWGLNRQISVQYVIPKIV